jgi:hypothetical protein
MKYMAMVKSVEGSMPPPELMQAIMDLGIEATKAGVMVGNGGLMPTATATRMRVTDGAVIVTDGPFTEAKEIIGGFAIYDVASREDVMKWVRRFIDLHRKHWPSWEGEVEVREMMEMPAYAE